MAMDGSEIERPIKQAFPDAEVIVVDMAGDGDQIAARVTSEAFKGARAALNSTRWSTVPSRSLGRSTPCPGSRNIGPELSGAVNFARARPV
jgi:hypothetical protein